MTITERESMSNRSVGVSPNVVVVGVVVIVLFVITILGYLVLAGRDIQSIVPVLTGFAIPTTVGMFALIKVDRQGSAVETIRKNTNGNFEILERRMAALESPVHAALNTGEMPVSRDEDPETEAFPFNFRPDPPKGGSRNG